MWCIPNITPEFIERMENVLDLYEKPYDVKEPMLCIEHRLRRKDYEYKRNGTRNIFVTVEPKGGYRSVTVTKKRTKHDFAKEVKRIINLPRYKDADMVHFVLDNLNTHFEKSFLETFGEEETKRIMNRIRFHYTPKHASWLDMAEIEIGILDRQCIKGRIPTEEKLKEKISAWSKERNRQGKKIDWRFTVSDARMKFRYSGAELS